MERMRTNMNEAFLQAMREETDPVADQVIEHLFTKGELKNVNGWLTSLSDNNEALPADLPEPVRQYFEQTSQLLEWADRKQMHKGAVFFSKHVQAILSVLGSLSLPYCYAAADGAQVLYLSQRIRKDTKKRLADTGQFVLNVLNPKAFDTKGTGIRSIQKVRLMHAAVRWHTLKSDQWNDVWGKPVNQEDMLGTNLAFSYIVLEGLHKLGIYYSSQEADAYLYLWNVIGYMLGMRKELLPENRKEAYWFSKLIEKRHFRKSEAGIELTKALMQSFEELTPSSAFKGLSGGYMRYLLGDKTADLLELPRKSLTNVLIKPISAVNTMLSLAGSLPWKNSSTYAVEAMLLAIEQENGKADFRMPVGLRE
ncbi:DUF2236 domain-containing protein [Rhodocytophaga rosea]|uniref:DUF2236 domain-containing protein n=1 Tax=Rhodocytophaga rosea TaxID=2704465 RepID=A0A6C0GKZ2_9BACT|nr:oxygenase MpaB family protein [Rhodocytophaga rosea]QHT68310.1 DUF2236 domain-containing protein [Rhodocytophaga rosea]